MTPRPKGKCSGCGRMMALKKDGTVRGHGPHNPMYANWCSGSGKKPVWPTPGWPYLARAKGDDEHYHAARSMASMTTKCGRETRAIVIVSDKVPLPVPDCEECVA